MKLLYINVHPEIAWSSCMYAVFFKIVSLIEKLCHVDRRTNYKLDKILRNRIANIWAKRT